MTATPRPKLPDCFDVGDPGATLVEFVAGSTLVLFLVGALAQVTMYAYAGNVARHAAHEGARVGAEMGRGESDALTVAGRLLGDGLGTAGRRFRIGARRDGARMVVDVVGEAPAVLPFVPAPTVRARSGVLLEDIRR